MNAPIGRMARVSRIATVTEVICVPNSAAMSLRMKTMRKKSKASSVQPRKLAATTWRCSLVQPSSASILMGIFLTKTARGRRGGYYPTGGCGSRECSPKTLAVRIGLHLLHRESPGHAERLVVVAIDREAAGLV